MNKFQSWVGSRNYWRVCIYLFMAFVIWRGWSENASLDTLFKSAVVMWVLYQFGYRAAVKDRSNKDHKEGKATS